MADLTMAPAGASGQVVSLSGTSAKTTNAIGAESVRLIATVDCWVSFGDDPTAVANTSLFLPANSVEYFKIRSTFKVAGLQSSSAGSLYVIGMQ